MANKKSSIFILATILLTLFTQIANNGFVSASSDKLACSNMKNLVKNILVTNPVAINLSDTKLNEILEYRKQVKIICSKYNFTIWEKQVFKPWLNGKQNPGQTNNNQPGNTSVDTNKKTAKKCLVESPNKYSLDEVLNYGRNSNDPSISAIFRKASGIYLDNKARLAQAGMSPSGYVESADQLAYKMLIRQGYKVSCKKLVIA